MEWTAYSSGVISELALSLALFRAVGMEHNTSFPAEPEAAVVALSNFAFDINVNVVRSGHERH